jgi:predicted Ser/Thr protein kinase
MLTLYEMSEKTSPEPELFVQLGVLDEEKLRRCLEFQKTFDAQGMALPLANVILNLGMAKPEQVARVLAHLGTATLRCPTCLRRFTVPDFQAPRRYKCQPCVAYLEAVLDESFQVTTVIPKIAGTPRHPSSRTLLPTQVAAKPDPFEGRKFGPFRILHHIAKGGMGAVYLAEDPTTGKKVAIKILTEEFSKMPGIQGRFKREGCAAARLEHPNIVSTIEMGHEEQYAYIAMEYLDGGSLMDLIEKEKRVAPARTVDLMCDILSGLQHAHGHGVVHRDIKPANVLLTSSGRAKVIDFGLAKDAEAQTILTLAGSVMGTPAFMAPEQAQGEGAGPPADLYSCGILTFLLLTGKKPFEGKGMVDTLNKQINEPLPSIRALNPEVPEALEAVVKKMCSKDPAKRHASPMEAIRSLRKAMGQAVEEEGTARDPSHKTGLEWALVLGVLAAGALAWALLWWIMNR